MHNATEVGILQKKKTKHQNPTIKQPTHPTALLKLFVMSVTILKGAFSVLQIKIMFVCSSSLKNCLLTLANAYN